MKYLTDKRLRAISLEPLFNEKSNPLSWMDRWLRNDSVEVLPQETEITSYLVGGIDMAIEDNDFAL
jgi:ribonucleoside-diphosphate reductase beta chain